MHNPRNRIGPSLVLGMCAIAISMALGVSAAGAQDASAATAASAHKTNAPADAIPSAHASKPYYVDFRARTAASYGHAFIWYGKVGDRKIEVAGLHPASDSVIPYIIGHVIPVPSETGKSYGDLDEQYLTASYRVYLSEAEAKRVFAYIKRLQTTSPLWNAALYNCVAFIQDVARYMGLRVPGTHLIYPETWVNSLRRLNSGREQTARAPSKPSAHTAEAAAR